MMSPELIQATFEMCLQRPEVKADARYCDYQYQIVITDLDGQTQIIPILLSQPGMSCITLKASSATWSKIWSAKPPVGYQSIGALRRQTPDFSIAGEVLGIVQSLPFLERLIQTFRNILHPQKNLPINWDGLENLTGSYLKIGSQKDMWIYQEQVGSKEQPSLLMFHTAGADSRQWHGLMRNEALQSEWDMRVFDLPGHGRSPLPFGSPNWNWRLTEDDYLGWIVDYMDAAQIKKAVLMGCSMGSAISLALMAKYPDRVIGGILLETPYRSPGRRSEYLNHPKVHGNRLAAAWVGSLLSPNSPQANKDYATWIYSQGAPSTYDGDLAFYSDDFDARHHSGFIDTQKTPLWLFTGDYDYSATPADTLKVAQEIPGAIFTELTGFGHFPMVENPDKLISYLLEPLAALKHEKK